MHDAVWKKNTKCLDKHFNFDKCLPIKLGTNKKIFSFSTASAIFRDFCFDFGDISIGTVLNLESKFYDLYLRLNLQYICSVYNTHTTSSKNHSMLFIPKIDCQCTATWMCEFINNVILRNLNWCWASLIEVSNQVTPDVRLNSEIGINSQISVYLMERIHLGKCKIIVLNDL